LPELVSMRERDLARMDGDRERRLQPSVSRANFADSLRAGYECRTLRLGGELVGYFISMVAAGEAHLLNLSIAAAHQRGGRGSALLRDAASSRARSAPQPVSEVRRAISARRRCITRFGSAGSAFGAATIPRRRARGCARADAVPAMSRRDAVAGRDGSGVRSGA